jgi:hypothetical protein
MKKLSILLLFLLALTQLIAAQNSRLYVSMHGGGKNILNFGKPGYNQYRFSSSPENFDTLICSGSGYQACKIYRHIIECHGKHGQQYKIYNKVIRQSRRYIRKSRVKSGEFRLNIKDRTLLIKFRNAEEFGQADMEISFI